MLKLRKWLEPFHFWTKVNFALNCATLLLLFAILLEGAGLWFFGFVGGWAMSMMYYGDLRIHRERNRDAITVGDVLTVDAPTEVLDLDETEGSYVLSTEDYYDKLGADLDLAADERYNEDVRSRAQDRVAAIQKGGADDSE